MEVEYTKEIRRPDIQDRLAIPHHWMRILGPLFREGEREALIRATCLRGFCWEFRCTIRLREYLQKPVLKAPEWRSYVNYMGIQEGDRFILREEENHVRQTNYIVTVQRKDADGRWADVQPPAHVAPAFHEFII